MCEDFETLDPGDWGEYGRVMHQAVDRAIAATAGLRDRPVWRPMTDQVRARLRQPLPQGPTPLAQVVDETWETVLAYPMGNTHPRFWMWYMGASDMTGALADFLAAVDGSNLGGGNHAAVLVERQVIDWLKQVMGFPETASGTLTSGGSVANLIGLAVARNHLAGADIRQDGVAALPQPLRIYASDQVHGCHQKAVELLGLGNNALRRIPSGEDCRIDLAALRRAIVEDRAAGFRPICVIGNAGTVNTGAVDALATLAAICRDERLWFHVDGCIGALTRLAPVTLDIVCFRYDPGDMDADALVALNTEIMMRLQEDGIAAFSDTVVHGEHGLRAAICNHRTTDTDLSDAVRALVATGDRLVGLREVQAAG